MQAIRKLLPQSGAVATPLQTDAQAYTGVLTKDHLRDTSSTELNEHTSSASTYHNVVLALASLTILFCTLLLLLAHRYLTILAQRRAKPARTRHSNHDQARRKTMLDSSTQETSTRNKPDADEAMIHQPHHAKETRGHLMIVLGSGGHTAEMMRILHNLGAEYLCTRFARRTYVLSTGDGFSAERARRFEEDVVAQYRRSKSDNNSNSKTNNSSTTTSELECPYEIVTVTRARKVHQPLLTTPISSLRCLYDCIRVLKRTHPDLTPRLPSSSHLHSYPNLILANGPATSTILIFAAFLLQFLGLAPTTSPSNSRSSSDSGTGTMRTVYIESFARVNTLSLSGEIVRLTGLGRVVVQWPRLAGIKKGVESVGIVVG